MSLSITRAQLDKLSPEEGAALWLVQRDGDGLVEAGLFEEWLESSELNRVAWERTNLRWSMFDDHGAFDDLRERAIADRPGRLQKFTNSWRSLAAAAGVAALLFGGLNFQAVRHMLGDTSAQSTGFQAQYAAAGSSARTIALPDGSSMTLGAGSALNVAFVEGQRRVSLDRGRASFAVAKNPELPFVVSAAGRTITAVGTVFEVALEPGHMVRVALSEGRVRFVGERQTIFLVPGQQLISVQGRSATVLPVETAAGEPQSPEIVQFDNETLENAIQRVNIDSPVKLVIIDKKVAALRISGGFRLRDARRFAGAVSRTLPIRLVQLGPDRIELRGRR